jgi:hypothetical protein
VRVLSPVQVRVVVREGRVEEEVEEGVEEEVVEAVAGAGGAPQPMRSEATALVVHVQIHIAGGHPVAADE